jgi:hypothetical protein
MPKTDENPSPAPSHASDKAKQLPGSPMAIGIALPGSVSPQHGAIRNANIQVINGYRLQDFSFRVAQR